MLGSKQSGDVTARARTPPRFSGGGEDAEGAKHRLPCYLFFYTEDMFFSSSSSVKNFLPLQLKCGRVYRRNFWGEEVEDAEGAKNRLHFFLRPQ